MFSKLTKGLLAGSVAATALMSANSAAAEDMVALLLPENVNPRWESQDAAAFVRTMSALAPDVKVEVFNANNDTSTQQRQAEQALTQGAKVLVVIPIDGESSAIIADTAAEEGIPTIAYDRMINSANTTFWVQADLEGMGYDQAMHIIDNTKDGDTLVMLKGSPTDPNAAVIHNGQLRALTPLYESGARIMGYENWTQGWDPAIARRSMDQALTQLDNNVQGVVSSNDGNAGAAIAAMEEQGMAGTVPVSGLDCTVQAQQLMLLGKQTQCGWRPLEDMAAAAAAVTVRLVNGEDFSDLAPDTVTNGVGAEVAYVPVGSYSAVGAEGVAYVIENDTSITKEMVCQGEAAATDFCQ
ncbi:sugar ABC transporter substrate-binding protein [Roseobacter sp. EG26]|uniref:ABC transporter substrate-binding protein n=1 Tax=Roseobacter sp. EG26 TaxID=3412477 RepID=UPI003CE56090